MSKHTPGPWGIVKDKRNINYGDIESCYNGALVCIMPEIDSGLEDELISEADARLIAAAPDIKELLRKAADELHAIGCGKDPADGLEMSEHIAEFLMTLDGEEPTDD